MTEKNTDNDDDGWNDNNDGDDDNIDEIDDKNDQKHITLWLLSKNWLILGPITLGKKGQKIRAWRSTLSKKTTGEVKRYHGSQLSTF